MVFTDVGFQWTFSRIRSTVSLDIRTVNGLQGYDHGFLRTLDGSLDIGPDNFGRFPWILKKRKLTDTGFFGFSGYWSRWIVGLVFSGYWMD